MWPLSLRFLHVDGPPGLFHPGGRPYAWTDDEITAPDRTWTAAHHPAPALLHRADPGAGLGEADYGAVAASVAGVAGGGVVRSAAG